MKAYSDLRASRLAASSLRRSSLSSLFDAEARLFLGELVLRAGHAGAQAGGEELAARLNFNGYWRSELEMERNGSEK